MFSKKQKEYLEIKGWNFEGVDASEFASIREFGNDAYSVLALGTSFLARHLVYNNERWVIHAANIRGSLADALHLSGYGPDRETEDWEKFKKALDEV